MRNEFTAIIERDGEWYTAYCPGVPGANGQGSVMGCSTAYNLSKSMREKSLKDLHGVLYTRSDCHV